MAQATGGMSFVDAMVEISTNGSSWTEVSGWANTVEFSGGDRALGEFFTADGDNAIVTAGKLNTYKVTVRVLYTESATTDPFEVVRTQHQTAGGGRLDVRVSPAGGAQNDYRFTLGSGKIETFVWPAGDASSGDALACEFTVAAATIVKDAVP